MMGDQTALGWRYDWFGNLEMIWLKEPDILALELIARRELNVSDEQPCSVTFLAEGAFNKVYTVQCSPNAHYILRVTLPVQPQLKTLSEVATTEFVHWHTGVPVPRIISFEASSHNELGFEWILMDYVNGSKLDDQWLSMSWMKKELLVRKVVSFLAQLIEKKFDHMGNLYKTKNLHLAQDPASASAIARSDAVASFDTDFCLGSVVEHSFFWGNNLKFEVNRGPFKNSRDWLCTILSLHLMSVDDPVIVDQESEDESEPEDETNLYSTPAAIKARIQRLMNLLPKIFPETESEDFVLHHHDLHQNNIFIGHDHELCSIIDWECLPTVPLWASCEIPKFLQTKLNRHLCPDPHEYMKETLKDGTEELNTLYYEHQAEYEKTQLRAFFLEEMQRVCPQWNDIYRNNKMKTTFCEVVTILGDKSNCSVIDEWLARMEEHGSAPGVGDILHAYDQEILDNQICLVKKESRKTEYDR